MFIYVSSYLYNSGLLVLLNQIKLSYNKFAFLTLKTILSLKTLYLSNKFIITECLDI